MNPTVAASAGPSVPTVRSGYPFDACLLMWGRQPSVEEMRTEVRSALTSDLNIFNIEKDSKGDEIKWLTN